MNNPITDPEELLGILMDATNKVATSRGITERALVDAAAFYTAHVLHHCLTKMPSLTTPEIALNVALDGIREMIETALKSNNTNS